MDIALARIHFITFAQCVQAVALPWMQTARHRQRVENGCVIRDLRLRVLHEHEFLLKKADIEGRVVNDQFCVFDEGQKVVNDLGKARLDFKIRPADAMHAFRALVNVAVRVQEAMKVAAGQATIHEFHAADFDNAVTLARGQARGFSVEYYLSHFGPCRSAPCAR